MGHTCHSSYPLDRLQVFPRTLELGELADRLRRLGMAPRDVVLAIALATELEAPK